MPDVTRAYKNYTITSLSNSGAVALSTAGKYLEDDLTITYTAPLPNLSSISITNLASNEYTITNAYTNLSDVGERTAYITVRLSNIVYENYYLEGNVQEKEYTVDITIDYLKIKKPTPKDITYTYNGLEQTMEFDDFDSNTMIISGNVGTNPGNYSVLIY